MGERQEKSAHHSQRNKGIAICVGLVITALAVLEGWQGWVYEEYELKSYDTRMRRLNNISANDQYCPYFGDSSAETCSYSNQYRQFDLF